MTKSRRKAERDARRRAAFRDGLAKARTPAERFHTAAEYLRAALTRAGDQDAEATARKVIPLIVQHAERLNGGSPR